MFLSRGVFDGESSRKVAANDMETGMMSCRDFGSRGIATCRFWVT